MPTNNPTNPDAELDCPAFLVAQLIREATEAPDEQVTVAVGITPVEVTA